MVVHKDSTDAIKRRVSQMYRHLRHVVPTPSFWSSLERDSFVLEQSGVRLAGGAATPDLELDY
jgi:hypothetical protein